MKNKEQVSEIIRVRVTAKEYKEIAAKAEKAGRKISDYGRRVLTGQEKP